MTLFSLRVLARYRKVCFLTYVFICGGVHTYRFACEFFSDAGYTQPGIVTPGALMLPARRIDVRIGRSHCLFHDRGTPINRWTPFIALLDACDRRSSNRARLGSALKFPCRSFNMEELERARTHAASIPLSGSELGSGRPAGPWTIAITTRRRPRCYNYRLAEDPVFLERDRSPGERYPSLSRRPHVQLRKTLPCASPTCWSEVRVWKRGTPLLLTIRGDGSVQPTSDLSRTRERATFSCSRSPEEDETWSLYDRFYEKNAAEFSRNPQAQWNPTTRSLFDLTTSRARASLNRERSAFFPSEICDGSNTFHLSHAGADAEMLLPYRKPRQLG